MSESRTRGRWQSARQVRNAQIASYPGDSGKVVNAVWAEVVSLHSDWRTLLMLFLAGNDETSSILNETAPGFFRHVQMAIWTTLVIRIGRLTDPVSTRGQRNASLWTLFESLESDLPRSLRTSLRRDLVRLDKAAKPVRKYRNKSGGHLDYLVATRSRPLPVIGKPRIERCLRIISDFMSHLSKHFEGPEQEFEIINDDTEDLLFWLKYGLERDKSEREAALRKPGIPCPGQAL